MSEGLAQAGLTPVLGVDWWNIAIQSYHDNFSEAKKMVYDVRKITADDLPDAEVIVGSPPCKAASKANTQGIGEITWDILEHILDLIEEKQPRYWILENVQQYWTKMPDNIRERIPSMVKRKARHYGLHHHRQRVFMGRFPEPPIAMRAPVLFSTPTASEYSRYRTKGHKGVPVFHDYLNRVPSPMEMLWAMGFPPGYKLAGSRIDKITQVGNAVCPPVARAFGLAIMKASKTSQER